VTLEQELRGLRIDFPPEPDVRANVLARLERPQRRRWLLASVAVVAAFGALLAIPQTRAAILRVLEIGGVRIERTETRPSASADGSPLVTGQRITLAEARNAVQFPLAVPRRFERVYLDRRVPGGMVSFAWDGHVLSEWQGRQIYEKSVGPGTEVRQVQIDFAPGVWLTGAPHSLTFVDRRGEPRHQTRRLAGNVLIWHQGGITYRLEGAKSLEEALSLVPGNP
jgi:hypothetical protein